MTTPFTARHRRAARDDTPSLPKHIADTFEADVLRACEQVCGISGEVVDRVRCCNLSRATTWISHTRDRVQDGAQVLDSLLLVAQRAIASFRTRLNDTVPVVRLPTDILEEIAGYLDRDTCYVMRGTCFSWNIALTSCPSLWRDLAWICARRDDPMLEADVQLLDFWLSLTSRAHLQLRLAPSMESEVRGISRVSDTGPGWPLDVYAPVVERHQHRIRSLSFSLLDEYLAPLFIFLPCLPATQALTLKVASAGADSASSRRFATIFRGIENVRTLTDLKSLHLVNFSFDAVAPGLPIFSRLELVKLSYNARFDVRTAWLVNAWAACPALKELHFAQVYEGIVDEPTHDDEIVLGRCLQRLHVSVPSYSHDVLRRLHHGSHRAVTIAWMMDEEDDPYYIFSDLPSPTSLSFTREENTAYDMQVKDARGFLRTVESILPVSVEEDTWDYWEAWDHINAVHLRTITVDFGHWLVLCQGIDLPAVETVVVRVLSSRDCKLYHSERTVLVPNLRTVRVEAKAEVEWRPLGKEVIIAILKSLAPSSYPIHVLEFNRRARVMPEDCTAFLDFVGEIVME